MPKKMFYTKLTKAQLDTLTSTCGLIAAAAELAFATEILNKRQAFVIISLATAVWAWYTNRLRPPSMAELSAIAPRPFLTDEVSGLEYDRDRDRSDSHSESDRSDGDSNEKI